MKTISKNLHLIFLVIGILWGFFIFATASAVDPIAGLLAYLFFYLPAFFGGLFSGKDRADKSEFLDTMGDAIDDLFKININHMTDSPNHLLALTITLFYFAFWIILAFAHEIATASLILQWILPVMILGFLSNQNSIESVKPFILKFVKFFKASLLSSSSDIRKL